MSGRAVSVSSRDCEVRDRVPRDRVPHDAVPPKVSGGAPARTRGGQPKPTLGYPSRKAAIEALRAQGLSTAEIADTIGITRTNVLSVETSARHPREATVRINVPLDVYERLGLFAAARGVTSAALAATILDAVVDEGLVDAVLDDGDDCDTGEDA